MNLNPDFVNLFSEVTSRAAIASYSYVGSGDKHKADEAAVNIMRQALNQLDIKGKIVIGEGELDEAPMLYIGENVGKGIGEEIDLAVDPIEGTNFVAKNLPGGISVLTAAPKNCLLNAPETYMHKIAFSGDVEKDALDLDFTYEKNFKNLADSLNKNLEELSICLLDRPRHKEIIEVANNFKIKKKLISDGDVAGALLVANKKFNIDMFLGIGGGPEGVIAASALDAYNCNFKGRFIFSTDEDKIRAKKMGIKDLNKKYDLKDIVKADSIFSATGITSGELVNGVKSNKNEFITQTLITHKSKNFIKKIEKTTIIK
tara:strand:+ start:1314 stop:2261 length:948 start_codon:yes stop_codon:yes gene_type:complete